MAIPVTPQLQIGSFHVTEFISFSLSQSLFEHHQFSLSIPYDRVEGTKNAFLSKAHQDLCGQRFTATLTPTLGTGGAGELTFQGLVTKLDLCNQGDLTGVIQVHGYGPTYLLDQAPVRRTFRQQTLLAIFQQVLRAYGNDLPPLQAAPGTRPRYSTWRSTTKVTLPSCTGWRRSTASGFTTMAKPCT